MLSGAADICDTYDLISHLFINISIKMNNQVRLSLPRLIQLCPHVLKQIQKLLQLPITSLDALNKQLKLAFEEKGQKLCLLLFQLRLASINLKQSVNSTKSLKQIAYEKQVNDGFDFVNQLQKMLPRIILNSKISCQNNEKGNNFPSSTIANTLPGEIQKKVLHEQAGDNLLQSSMHNLKLSSPQSQSLSFKGLFQMGKCFVGRHEFEKALQCLQKLQEMLKELNELNELRESKQLVQLEIAKLQKLNGLNDFQESLTVKKIGLPYTLYLIGICYYYLRRYDKSLSYLKQSLENEENSVMSIEYLALIYKTQNNQNEQLALYDDYSKSKSKQVKAKVGLLKGKYYERKNDLLKAQDQFKKIKAQKEEISYIPQACKGLAKIQMKRNNYQASVKSLFESIKLDIQYRQFKQVQSFCLLALMITNKNINESIKVQIRIFMREIQEQEDRDWVDFRLSIFYKQIGDYASSSKMFIKCFKPLAVQFNNARKLSENNFQIAAQMIYKYGIASKVISSQQKQRSKLFDFQKMLLFYLMNRKEELKFIFDQTIKLYRNNASEDWTKIFKNICTYLLSKNINTEYLTMVCEVLICKLLQISHKSSITCFQYALKEKIMLNQQFLKDKIQLHLKDQSRQIDLICLVVSKFKMNPQNQQTIINVMKQIIKIVEQSAQAQDNQVREISQVNQVVRNIIEMIQLYQWALSWSQNQNNNNPLSLLIELIISQEISKTSQLHKSIIREIPMEQRLYSGDNGAHTFFLIEKEKSLIYDKLSHAIKDFKANKLTQDFLYSVKKVIESFLTLPYLKNELIKFIWVRNYVFFNYLQKQKGIQIIQLFEKVKKDHYNLKELTSELNGLFTKNHTLPNIVAQNQFKKDKGLHPDKNQKLRKTHSIQKSFSSMPKLFAQLNNPQPIHEKILLQAYQDISVQQLSLTDKKSLSNLLIFKNIHDNMQTLSMEGLNLKYIVKYFMDLESQKQFLGQGCFSYRMQLGELIYTEHFLNEELMLKCVDQSNEILPRTMFEKEHYQEVLMVDHLWKEGPKQIIKYILCLTKFIKELDQLNVVHTDIQFRNSSKIGDIYKFSGLDFALKYGKTKNQTSSSHQCFKNTQVLIKILLSLNPSKPQERQIYQKILYYMFKDCNQAIEAKITKIIQSNSRRQQSIIEQLGEYSKKYHLRQFQRMMKFLLIQGFFQDKFKRLNTFTNNYIVSKIKYEQYINFLEKLY